MVTITQQPLTSLSEQLCKLVKLNLGLILNFFRLLVLVKYELGLGDKGS